jgi:hypothetical protein
VVTELTSWLGDDKGEEKDIFGLELLVKFSEFDGVWLRVGVRVNARGGDRGMELSFRLRSDGGDTGVEIRGGKIFICDGLIGMGDCGRFGIGDGYKMSGGRLGEADKASG